MDKPIGEALYRRWLYSLVCLSILSMSIIYIYRESFLGMVSIWYRSETFTHGFLVPPIVSWLIWRQRAVLKKIEPRPNFLFLFALAFVGFIWLLGDLVSVNSVTQLAVVGILVLSVPAVIGWRSTSKIIFPLGFLFFAVPVGEFLLPKLMAWTADFTILALQFSGVPVYREGLQFIIPSGSWSVVEACSGVRYLIASLTVGSLFAYLNYRSYFRRTIFIAISIVVPIAANWMRAYFIVMLGHYSGNKLAVGVDHLIYGWVFFGIVIMVMFGIGSRWSEYPSNIEPIKVNASTVKISPIGGNAFVVTLSIVVIALFFKSGKFYIEAHNALTTPQLVVSEQLGDNWKLKPGKVVNWSPQFVNPSVKLESTFDKVGDDVGVILVYYRNQSYDKKLISSNNVLVGAKDKNWFEVSRGLHSVGEFASATTFSTIDIRGHDGNLDSRIKVWKIYWINGFFTHSDYLAKIYSAFQSLLGRGDDCAAIVLYARDEDQNADVILNEFWRDNFNAIKSVLNFAKDS